MPNFQSDPKGPSSESEIQHSQSVPQRSASPPLKTVTIGMMAKYWTSGRVKTRLGATIGLEKSARLHKLFVTTLAKSLAIGVDPESSPLQFVAVTTPDDKQIEFGREIGASWTTEKQSTGDLGQRMQHWFSQTLQQTAVETQTAKAILIGADCPTLDDSVVAETIRLLEAHDFVLGPAIDGGYYLIAIGGPWRDAYQTLFADIPWSTGSVLDITQQRISDAGLTFALLQPREDIDTGEALDRLCESLRADESNLKHGQLLAEIEAILADNATTENAANDSGR